VTQTTLLTGANCTHAAVASAGASGVDAGCAATDLFIFSIYFITGIILETYGKREGALDLSTNKSSK
jgi:hypothetical protein